MICAEKTLNVYQKYQQSIVFENDRWKWRFQNEDADKSRFPLSANKGAAFLYVLRSVGSRPCGVSSASKRLQPSEVPRRESDPQAPIAISKTIIYRDYNYEILSWFYGKLDDHYFIEIRCQTYQKSLTEKLDIFTFLMFICPCWSPHS